MKYLKRISNIFGVLNARYNGTSKGLEPDKLNSPNQATKFS